MKPKFWETNEFKELEKEWYRKLEENKFLDIEKKKNGESFLRQRSGYCYRRTIQNQVSARQEYYELMAQCFQSEFRFKDEIEEYVMEKTAHGGSINEISRVLRNINERYHRGTIRLIIQKFEARWGIKKK